MALGLVPYRIRVRAIAPWRLVHTVQPPRAADERAAAAVCWHPRTRAQSLDQILYVNLGLRSVVGRFVAHRRRLHVGRISRIQLDGSVG
jgi:hypothetical protein